MVSFGENQCDSWFFIRFIVLLLLDSEPSSQVNVFDPVCCRFVERSNLSSMLNSNLKVLSD